MRCLTQYCYEPVEGEFEEILEKGYGYCRKGHRSVLPGTTKLDNLCECGATKTGQPGHSWYCPEKKGFP